MNIYTIHNKRSIVLPLVAGVLLSLLLGVIDYYTGIEISVSIFYLFPVVFVTWMAGRNQGIVLAAFCGLVWLLADIMASHLYSHPLILYWNALVRTGFFMIVVFILDNLKKSLSEKTKIVVEQQNMLEKLRHAEEQLTVKSMKLALSNQDLEQFAYAAAHDLKAPLLSVVGYIRSLQRRYGKIPDAEAQVLISAAIEASLRMEALINGLLNYARVMTEEKKLAPVDCTLVVEKALSNLRVIMEKNDVIITHDHLPTVETDQVLLIQLFQNLLANSIKFKGTDTPQIHITATKDSHEWIFSVQDNGIGVDAEDFERIFGMFKMGHGGMKYPGHGIGLALCKRIVEMHGGRIWVESIPGQGSTFYFTIPTIE